MAAVRGTERITPMLPERELIISAARYAELDSWAKDSPRVYRYITSTKEEPK